MSSQITSPRTINPDISLLRNFNVIIVRILQREYLWIAQYLEEVGVKVINSYKALSLSSNKLISDELMQQGRLKNPKDSIRLEGEVVREYRELLFPALAKPLYGRSKGILYIESLDD